MTSTIEAPTINLELSQPPQDQEISLWQPPFIKPAAPSEFSSPSSEPSLLSSSSDPAISSDQLKAALDSFMREESSAALLLRARNYDFGGHSERGTHAHWPGLVNPHANDVPDVSTFGLHDITADIERIIKLDSHRTFAGKECRGFLSEFLASLVRTSLKGEYHQSLSLVSGLLLLWFDKDTVSQMLHVVNAHPRYIPGYWRAEAVAFATDAYVFQRIMHVHAQDIARLLESKQLMPEIWLQKWFVGLCINVLPFPQLHKFFEGFLTHGHLFLLRFGLSFVNHFRPYLLNSPDQAQILAWLRLDEDKLRELPNHDILDKVLEDALNEASFPLDQFDIPAMRIECYDTHLRARMEYAAAARAKKDESDDSEDSDDEGSEEDDFGCGGPGDAEGEECENVPEHYCPDPPTLLCSDCRRKPPFRTIKCLTPEDLYSFSQKPEIAKKLADQKAAASLTEGVDKLSL